MYYIYIILTLLALSRLSMAEEIQTQYQVYEVVFNTINVQQYASYENPRWNYALYRKKTPSTYSFPVQIGDKLNGTFEYNPDATISRFKKSVRYHLDAISAFHIYADGFSVSSGYANEVGVDKDDWHIANDWSELESMLLGSDIPFLRSSEISLRFQKPMTTVTNTQYELENPLSLDYFNYKYGKGLQLWMWFNNRDVEGFESFTEQLVYAQGIELRKLTANEIVSYCIGNSYSTPACGNELGFKQN